jgi:DNA-binding response OmpR family regulator
MVECPHCGGVINGSALTPIEHPVFDDARRLIVNGESSWQPSPSEWRLLRALRERFGRWVDVDFLAVVASKSPSNGGSTEATKIRVMQLRRALEGTPFAIVTRRGFGYGLFRADDARPVPYRCGRRSYRLRADQQ